MNEKIALDVVASPMARLISTRLFMMIMEMCSTSVSYSANTRWTRAIRFRFIKFQWPLTFAPRKLLAHEIKSIIMIIEWRERGGKEDNAAFPPRQQSM